MRSEGFSLCHGTTSTSTGTIGRLRGGVGVLVAITLFPNNSVKMSDSSERVLVAMSGGVDSSVAALLMYRQGLAVEGAYMKNWINEENLIGNCPWQQDIEDARAVAEYLRIPFRVVNLMREYRAR